MFKRIVKRVVVWGLAALGLIQLVPYGRAHTNPPARSEPAWSSPRVRELAKRACFDCHSNETEWPWYSHVAPISWLVQRDVDKGRAHLNFSELDALQRHAHECAEELEEGDMPPWFYLPAHPRARLDDTEKRELIAGFRATFPDRRGRDRRDKDDD